MRCSFCGRSKPALGPVVTGPSVYICADCVRELLGFLLRLESAPLSRLAPLESGPCTFCGRRELQSAVRLLGRHGVICAACLSLCATILLEDDLPNQPPLPSGVRHDLHRLTAEIGQMYPDLVVRPAGPQ